MKYGICLEVCNKTKCKHGIFNKIGWIEECKINSCEDWCEGCPIPPTCPHKILHILEEESLVYSCDKHPCVIIETSYNKEFWDKK